ncbi:MAG: YIP1 family protein [Bacteroidales bacterium]|nr:YIP1 family protein [Bacteroidales bacterium]
MEDLSTQTKTKDSFKKPLIVLIIIYIIYGVLGFISAKYTPFEVFQQIITLGPKGDLIPVEQIQKQYELTQSLSWISIFLGGFSKISIMIVIGLALYIGFNIFETRQNFKTIMKCVIFSEFVFVIQTALVIPITFNGNFECFNQTLSFPFSILSLLDVCKLDAYMVGILRYINIFELTYFCLLAFLLVKNIDLPKSKIIKVSVYSYGIILLISMTSSTISAMAIEKLANL